MMEGYLIGGTSDKITLNVTNSHTQYIITWTCSNLVNIKTLTTTVNITWAQLDADDWGWLKGSAASVERDITTIQVVIGNLMRFMDGIIS